MENTTDYLKPYLLLICRKKQKIGTGKVRDNNKGYLLETMEKGSDKNKKTEKPELT